MTSLNVKLPLEAKIRFMLLWDSCGSFDMGSPHWWGLSSVDRLNCFSPRQHSHSSFQISSKLSTKNFLLPEHVRVSVLGPPLRWWEGSVFLFRRNVCCTVVTGLSASRPVKFLLAFTSTVNPGFSLLEIHGQDISSPLDMCVFRNGAFSWTIEGSTFLCMRYVCCTVVSARVYPRCHGVQVTVDCIPLSLHNTIIFFYF
jgi:hypothetical protein